MTNDERRNKAIEIIEVMGMWGIGLDDCKRIVKAMEAKLAVITIMPNPLSGTGLRPVKQFEKGLSESQVRQRIFHEPIEKETEQ